MNRTIGQLAALAVLACASATGAEKEVPRTAPADFVDVFIGTAGSGHTFPAAAVPFGLVQAGPDTGNHSWKYCSGYHYDDGAITAFSQTHLNGTGCNDLGDLALLPYRGEDPVPLRFAHSDEAAEPGYYSVYLTNEALKVEIAAAPHSAIYRICGEGRINLRVDPTYGLNFGGRKDGGYLGGKLSPQADGTGLSGSVTRKAWVKRTFSYAIRFSRAGTPAAGTNENVRTFAFDLSKDSPLLVKLALSAEGDVARAERNLAAEIPAWDFDGVRGSARAAWNECLGCVEAEGSAAQKKILYTALYHAFLQPNDIADVGETPFYSTFSCWDAFRCVEPLYALVAPERLAGIVDSMLKQGRRTGYVPIFIVWGVENQCMIGTHSIPWIVDAFLKGIGSRDAAYWEAAYGQIRDTLTQRHPERKKEQWDVYDRYGYYPFDIVRGESVSRTLECSFDDWCAGTMARKLGKADDAEFFFRRSAYWKNVFDPKLGLMRGKDSDGKWREPFNPYRLGVGAGQANDFTEGNSFQYTWHVLQDPAGLIEAMGGKEAFVAKLDSLFTERADEAEMGKVRDVTGLIGQYAHGNEPSHHVPYFYTLAGRPDRTAERVREICDLFYAAAPGGLCGNDDCGQMSAWYVFAAMGFYPFNTCGGEYVIGAPQLPKVTLRLAGGRTFTVEAEGLSAANKYVSSVSFAPGDGSASRAVGGTLPCADVLKGGRLLFKMTDRCVNAKAGRAHGVR